MSPSEGRGEGIWAYSKYVQIKFGVNHVPNVQVFSLACSESFALEDAGVLAAWLEVERSEDGEG